MARLALGFTSLSVSTLWLAHFDLEAKSVPYDEFKENEVAILMVAFYGRLGRWLST